MLLRLERGLECGALLDPEPEPDRDRPERARHEERDAPPEVPHRGLAQGELEDRDECRSRREAEVGAHVEEAREVPPPLVRGVLAHEGRGPGVLAAGREALEELDEDQQDRRGDADLCIARQEAEGEGRRGHQDQRHGEHPLAADPVAEPSEEHTAEGAGDEGRGEGAEEEEGLDDLVRLGEEDRAHRRDEVAEDADVVPLHRVADDGSPDRPAQHGPVDDVDVGHPEATLAEGDAGLAGGPTATVRLDHVLASFSVHGVPPVPARPSQTWPSTVMPGGRLGTSSDSCK